MATRAMAVLVPATSGRRYFKSGGLLALAVLMAVLLLAAGAGAQSVRWFQRTSVAITDLDVSEEGRFVVAGVSSGLILYDKEGNRTWGTSLAEVSQVAISPDGQRIAAAAGGKIHLFDQAGNLLWQYGEGGAQFTSVDLSRDRVIGGAVGRMVVLDFLGIVVWSKPLCSGASSITFSPDAKQISAASSTCVYLLDALGNELVSRNLDTDVLTVAGGNGRVTGETRGGELLSAAVQASSWRLQVGEVPVSLAMAPGGWFIVASGWNLYQVGDDGTFLKKWLLPSPGQAGPIQSAALSPDGSVLVFAVPGNLTVWDRIPAPPAGPATPSPSPTPLRVFVCPDGTTVDDPARCPRVASPPPSPLASPQGSAPPAVSAPPPASPPSGPGLSIPVGPIAAAAVGVLGTVLGVRWVRKNREAIDRWRLERRMRRI